MRIIALDLGDWQLEFQHHQPTAKKIEAHCIK